MRRELPPEPRPGGARRLGRGPEAFSVVRDTLSREIGRISTSSCLIIIFTRQTATCQAPLLQLFAENACSFRIPFGDHPLKLERYRED